MMPFWEQSSVHSEEAGVYTTCSFLAKSKFTHLTAKKSELQTSSPQWLLEARWFPRSRNHSQLKLPHPEFEWTTLTHYGSHASNDWIPVGNTQSTFSLNLDFKSKELLFWAYTCNKMALSLACCYYSVTQSCLTLCDHINCIPVLHYLPEFAQAHVHWVNDAIQPSHPLLLPCPPSLNLSQHLGLLVSQLFTSGS